MKTHHGRKNLAGGHLVEATPRQGDRREQEVHPTYQTRKHKAHYRMGMPHGEIHRQCHHRNNRCRCISMVWQAAAPGRRGRPESSNTPPLQCLPGPPPQKSTKGMCSRTSRLAPKTEALRNESTQKPSPGMCLLNRHTKCSTAVTSAARMAARAIRVGLCTAGGREAPVWERAK